MNLEQFASLEQELEASYDEVKTFLKEKGISTNTYY
jgi:effector-binding domain-containing protein